MPNTPVIKSLSRQNKATDDDAINDVFIGAAAFIGLLVCFVGEWRSGTEFFPSPATSTLTYFVLYSLVILAFLSVENKPRPILDETFGALGAASYILYIIHEPLYSVLQKAFLVAAPRTFAASLPGFFLTVVVAVAISLSMHYGIERPTLRKLRRILLPSTRPIKIMTTI